MKNSLCDGWGCICGMCILISSFPAIASSNDLSASEASAIITREAESLCLAPPIEHTESGVSLTVDGKAKLKGLIQNLADGGIGAAIKVNHDNGKRAVTEEQLAAALKSTNDCRSSVIQSLSVILNPKSDSVSGQPSVQCQNSQNGSVSISSGNNSIIANNVCAKGDVNLGGRQ
jgi:hypothetical protein